MKTELLQKSLNLLLIFSFAMADILELSLLWTECQIEINLAERKRYSTIEWSADLDTMKP